MRDSKFAKTWLAVAALVLVPAPPAHDKILHVGPDKQFKTPCQAMPHTSTGDTVEIDSAGDYKGDVCAWTANELTLRGVGDARAHIDAAGKSAQGKGIWVIAGNDTTVENVEFSGGTSSDQNGAGIRQEGRNLKIRNCYFHDNQEGILAGDNPQSEILIEFSEFGYNGSGDGSTHNIYVSHVGKFTLQFSYSHHAKIGHLLKTRAAENYIQYNRLSDEADGTASFEIDISNRGTSYVIGNVIEQGPQTDNSAIVAYGMEGPDPRNPGSQLYVINNTFVNDLPDSGTFIIMRPDISTPAIVMNNIFWGRGTVMTQRNAVMSGNLIQKDPKFVDPADYDYRLQSRSPALGAGTKPQPAFVHSQYIHPACGAPRGEDTSADVGAFSATIPDERLGPARCQVKR
jgi:Right handed beta helix region